MKHLSLLTALMLSSSMVNAQNCEGWQSAANGRNFKGDCYEMMCDCVEKDGVGYCCPVGTSTENTGANHPDLCPCKCPENQTWDTTTNACSCSFGTTQYTNYLGEKACCNTTTHTLSDITGTQNKSCCPIGQTWDVATNGCISSKVCTTLYKNKNKINDERYKAGECCEPEQKLVNDRTSTLFEGYKSKEERYGCCLAENVYIKTDGTTGCCNPETHSILEIEGGQACCPKDKPHWDADSQTCLAACGPDTEFGIVLILDRSGSMQKSYTDEWGDRDKRYNVVDKALAELKFYTNAYSAVFEHDAGKAPLKWGKHSKKQFKDAIYNYTLTQSGGTGFNEAFNEIEGFCEGDQKFVILWMTDGEINKDTKKLKNLLKTRNCSAVLYMVSKKDEHKEKYSADKWVSFSSFSENTITEFNQTVDAERCYREGERSTPQTIGLPSCPFGYGYFKGQCNECVDYAESCHFKELICMDGACQKGDKCYLKPANAFCTTESGIEGGWKCEANYYKQWARKQCVPCPNGKRSPAGSYTRSHCK
ncbi:MAG: VWA domain-containing protein [Alphaproteobacteria bacterium]|nr:VWA domain-containing protein [Alphaproteobacteria bacterium]